ncbi:MAG: transporter substrate-binding domain-containing protein [Synergistaceae bacterium]|nr:transporter substrate-binding domain-containing protein [Synergistaceae bacterium]
MKKVLVAILIAILALGVFVFMNSHGGLLKDKNTLDTGVLAYLGTTEEEFQQGFDTFRGFVLSSDNAPKDGFIASLAEYRRIFHFYDSIMSLMMDLKAGELNEMILPESVGRYLLKQNSFYRHVLSTEILSSGICFGFKEDTPELRDSFNKIIDEMETDGTLDGFEETYVNNQNNRDPKPTRPDTIKDAEELRIVVTGDMPPIDMFAGDGKPTGYNTAVLSEIGKRLGKNIKFVNTDAGGRAAALLSGRADVVFWFRATESTLEGPDPFDDLFKDVPEGVILSKPYYSWGNEIVIRMKDKQGLLGLFSSQN